MITGPALQNVTAADRFESSVTPMQYPAPRAAERFVFSDLECFCDASVFNFGSTFAGFFLQFAFHIGNIFFKTDDPPSGHDLLPVGQRAVSPDISTYGSSRS